MARSDYQERLRDRWASAPLTALPAPWTKSPNGIVGGVYAVGLDDPGRFVLSVSLAGRYVIDCRSGETVHRDHDDSEESWLDSSRLLIDGVGPLANERIRVAGSFLGGGMAATTSDGWSVHRAAPEWPKEVVWVEEPDQPGFYQDGTFHKVWDWDAPFALGFSTSGTTLVVACSNRLDIWVR